MSRSDAYFKVPCALEYRGFPFYPGRRARRHLVMSPLGGDIAGFHRLLMSSRWDAVDDVMVVMGNMVGIPSERCAEEELEDMAVRSRRLIETIMGMSRRHPGRVFPLLGPVEYRFVMHHNTGHGLGAHLLRVYKELTSAQLEFMHSLPAIGKFETRSRDWLVLYSGLIPGASIFDTDAPRHQTRHSATCYRWTPAGLAAPNAARYAKITEQAPNGRVFWPYEYSGPEQLITAWGPGDGTYPKEYNTKSDRVCVALGPCTPLVYVLENSMIYR